MKILVTGAAGFIGYHLCKKLAENSHSVIGIDNINDYYSTQLKIDRLNELGFISNEVILNDFKAKSTKYNDLFFKKIALENENALENLFKSEKFEVVVNLAAQAGVRYSLENPKAYIQSNIVGFSNILECCRHHNIKHLIYASSSSVYGNNKEIPFKTTDRVDTPISLYAATKKSNELMAHTYSHLYNLPTTGLRFFTVYGPWGRPDMAMFLFVDAILNRREIKVFNHGKMERDFTFVDDIVEGIFKIVENKNSARNLSVNPYKVYNIGNNSSVKLLDFIEAIESELKIKAKKNMMPIQPGDVEKTWADVDALIKDYHYKPNTPINDGVKRFISWYRNYYNK